MLPILVAGSIGLCGEPIDFTSNVSEARRLIESLETEKNLAPGFYKLLALAHNSRRFGLPPALFVSGILQNEKEETRTRFAAVIQRCLKRLDDRDVFLSPDNISALKDGRPATSMAGISKGELMVVVFGHAGVRRVGMSRLLLADIVPASEARHAKAATSEAPLPQSTRDIQQAIPNTPPADVITAAEFIQVPLTTSEAIDLTQYGYPEPRAIRLLGVSDKAIALRIIKLADSRLTRQNLEKIWKTAPKPADSTYYISVVLQRSGPKETIQGISGDALRITLLSASDIYVISKGVMSTHRATLLIRRAKPSNPAEQF